MRFLIPVILTPRSLALGVEVHEDGKAFVLKGLPADAVIDARFGGGADGQTLVDVLVKHEPRVRSHPAPQPLIHAVG